MRLTHRMLCEALATLLTDGHFGVPRLTVAAARPCEEALANARDEQDPARAAGRSGQVMAVNGYNQSGDRIVRAVSEQMFGRICPWKRSRSRMYETA